MGARARATGLFHAAHDATVWRCHEQDSDERRHRQRHGARGAALFHVAEPARAAGCHRGDTRLDRRRRGNVHRAATLDERQRHALPCHAVEHRPCLACRRQRHRVHAHARPADGVGAVVLESRTVDRRRNRHDDVGRAGPGKRRGWRRDFGRLWDRLPRRPPRAGQERHEPVSRHDRQRIGHDVERTGSQRSRRHVRRHHIRRGLYGQGDARLDAVRLPSQRRCAVRLGHPHRRLRADRRRTHARGSHRRRYVRRALRAAHRLGPVDLAGLRRAGSRASRVVVVRRTLARQPRRRIRYAVRDADLRVVPRRPAPRVVVAVGAHSRLRDDVPRHRRHGLDVARLAALATVRPRIDSRAAGHIATDDGLRRHRQHHARGPAATDHLRQRASCARVAHHERHRRRQRVQHISNRRQHAARRVRWLPYRHDAHDDHALDDRPHERHRACQEQRRKRCGRSARRALLRRQRHAGPLRHDESLPAESGADRARPAQLLPQDGRRHDAHVDHRRDVVVHAAVGLLDRGA